MTQRRFRSGPCGKRIYTSRKVAAFVAAQKARELSQPIQAFHCDACHGHHIGHPPGWRRENGRGLTARAVFGVPRDNGQTGRLPSAHTHHDGQQRRTG